MPEPFQVSDPAPAPMMGVAPFRADFPGAYQQSPGGGLVAPSGDVQTFNEPQPGPGGMKASDLKEAMSVVQAAMRFQGARGLAADLQSGMDPHAALLKNGEKLFASAPAQYAGMIAKMGLGNKMGGDTGPLKLRPVIGPDGEAVEGMGAVGGQGTAVHIVPTNKAALEKSKEASKVAKAAEAADKKLLAAAIKERDATPAKSPRFPKLQAAVDALQSKLAGGATGPVKVKHKKTGQIFNYKGNAADVPADEYEVMK